MESMGQESRDRLVSVLDVAEWMLQRKGPMEPLKLQKLVYYAQAWSLVWSGSPLYCERIEAWVHGPVVPLLYQMHLGRQAVVTVGGEAAQLTTERSRMVELVLHYYGDKKASELRRLTHDESPWREARGTLPENRPSTNEISHESMLRCYRNLPCGGAAPVRDVSAFDSERAERAKREIAEGNWVDLDGLARALQG